MLCSAVQLLGRRLPRVNAADRDLRQKDTKRPNADRAGDERADIGRILSSVGNPKVENAASGV